MQTLKNFKVQDRYKEMIYSTIAFTLIFILLWKTNVYADDGRSLMDLYKTEASRGSLEWLDKAQWIGIVSNFIISACCLIVAFFTMFSTIITVAYFSNPAFWKNVNEAKGNGLGTYMVDTINGFKGGGLDSLKGLDKLMDIVYVIAPDIYKYSEMYEETRAANLNEDESLVTWFLKTGLMKVLILFAAAMGMNGQLMQIYAMIVDGLGVLGARVAHYQLDEKIETILNEGMGGPSFALGQSGKPNDEIRETVAEDIYRHIVGKTRGISLEDKTQIGTEIENYVAQNYTDDKLYSMIKKTWGGPEIGGPDKLTEGDWKKVKANIVINDSNSASAGEVVALSKICPSLNKPDQYAHILIRLTGRANDKNYFSVKGEKDNGDISAGKVKR